MKEGAAFPEFWDIYGVQIAGKGKSFLSSAERKFRGIPRIPCPIDWIEGEECRRDNEI